MAKTLDFLIENGQVKGKFVPVNLEVLLTTGTLFIHYLYREYRKEKLKGKKVYSPIRDKERTIVYEFDYQAPELKCIRKHKGNFKDTGYRWNENLLNEYISGQINEKEKDRAHRLVEKIIKQLEEDRRKAGSMKEKDNYGFFIRTLEKLGAKPGH